MPTLTDRVALVTGAARRTGKAIARALSIESEPGKGSIFRFTGAFSEPRVEQDQDSDKPFKLAGASALIIDGNATSREILQYYLSDWGMTSTGAGDGQQALQLLRTAVNKGEDRVEDRNIIDGQKIVFSK